MYETRVDNVLGYFIQLTDYSTKEPGIYFFGPQGFIAMIPKENGLTNIVGQGLSTYVVESPSQIAELIRVKL